MIKSSSSSSTSSTLMGASCMKSSSFVGRELNHFKPVSTQDLDYLHQRFEGHGLGNVGVYAQIVSAKNVLFRFGSGEHNNRNPAEFGMRLDFLQSFPPVLAGHVQVEQNQPRKRRVSQFLV